MRRLHMKKATLFLAAAALALTLAGCGSSDFETKDVENGVMITGYSGSSKNLKIPEMINGKTVTEIGKMSFYNCDSLTSVTVPGSVTKIGNSTAFSGIGNLTSINVADGNPNYFSVDGVLYEKAQDNKIVLFECPEGKSGKITIPDNVTEIGRAAFSGCNKLTEVTVPDGVTQIGKSAFASCTNLTSVNIPDKVTEIYDCAFAGCHVLTDIIIPDGVTKIGERGIADCYNLTSINIPDSVTKIDKYAFVNCVSLTSANIGSGVTEIAEDAFYKCNIIQATYKGKTYDYEHITDLYDAINNS